jgi:hypothetical protein
VVDTVAKCAHYESEGPLLGAICRSKVLIEGSGAVRSQQALDATKVLCKYLEHLSIA